MAAQDAAAFWAVSFLFVITPGADWAYAISAGLRYSSVLPAVAGMLAGHLLATIAVAAGLAAFVAESATALTVLTIVGAAYLMWLGLGVLTGAGDTVRVSERGGASRIRQALTGLGVSGLNPKVFLLFLALLPQFIDPEGSCPVAGQAIALGSMHVASCAVVYSLVGIGSRRALRTRPGVSRIVTRTCGLAMLGIGAALVVDQVTRAY